MLTSINIVFNTFSIRTDGDENYALICTGVGDRVVDPGELKPDPTFDKRKKTDSDPTVMKYRSLSLKKKQHFYPFFHSI